MNPAQQYYERIGMWLNRGERFVSVTIVDAQGSVPAEAGSRMIVTVAGLDFGTVGGGRIEAKAIDEALQLLHVNRTTLFCDWSLKADVGMTCGGRVRLYFEVWNSVPWSIVIFGAGHVTQALVRILETFACQITCIDPRREWIEKLPSAAKGIVDDNPASYVDGLADDTFVLCMTKGHQSDFPVLQQIFLTGRQFPFLGVIGSRAKAAVLRKQLIEAGAQQEQLVFHCPVGLMVDETLIGKHQPNEIAVSIAAQLLQMRDRVQVMPKESAP